jgi:hypothetical protein
MAASIADTARAARRAGKHVLVHAVHGSKTGLVLPAFAEIDRLNAEFGDGISWAVDACQARIEPEAIAAYLDSGAIVFLTGSNFIGGPPFSGVALVPGRVAAAAAPLPIGFRTLLFRDEWPLCWPGADQLIAGCNHGLMLRLEAAIFELERFRLLALADVGRVIAAFATALDGLADHIGACRTDHGVSRNGGMLEEGTLATLDLSPLASGCDLEDAQRWHRTLVERDIRLGQPVKHARFADGRWRPTVRIGLSMPMIVDRAGADDDALIAGFRQDMARIATAILDCVHPRQGTARRASHERVWA